MENEINGRMDGETIAEYHDRRIAALYARLAAIRSEVDANLNEDILEAA